MTLKTLIQIASTGYPGGLIKQYHEEPETEHGDHLAAFIANELKETFDPEADDIDQLSEAMDKMEKAIGEINGVIAEFDAVRAFNMAKP